LIYYHLLAKPKCDETRRVEGIALFGFEDGAWKLLEQDEVAQSWLRWRCQLCLKTGIKHEILISFIMSPRCLAVCLYICVRLSEYVFILSHFVLIIVRKMNDMEEKLLAVTV